jgi:hypothetical protein
MDIPLTVPHVWIPLFVGVLALLAGNAMVGAKSLVLRLLGIVVALGGVNLMFAPFPNRIIPAGVKLIVVIIVFIGLSAQLARSGWKTNRATTIAGGVLTLIGVLALYMQLQSYITVPTGNVQQVIADGFASISRILNLAGKSVE